jgi:hypothetical protein
MQVFACASSMIGIAAIWPNIDAFIAMKIERG